VYLYKMPINIYSITGNIYSNSREQKRKRNVFYSKKIIICLLYAVLILQVVAACHRDESVHTLFTTSAANKERIKD